MAALLPDDEVLPGPGVVPGAPPSNLLLPGATLVPDDDLTPGKVVTLNIKAVPSTTLAPSTGLVTYAGGGGETVLFSAEIAAVDKWQGAGQVLVTFDSSIPSVALVDLKNLYQDFESTVTATSLVEVDGGVILAFEGEMRATTETAVFFPEGTRATHKVHGWVRINGAKGWKK